MSVTGYFFLFFCFALLLSAAVMLTVAWEKCHRKLLSALRQSAEIGNFLELFSRSLRSNDELSEAMNQSAEYIAEMIMAQAVCIYRLENGVLRVAGSSGEYFMAKTTLNLPRGNAAQFREALRAETLNLGEGLVGGVALSRSSALLPDAKHDERLNHIPIEKCPEQVMVVPICRNDELSGVICAISDFVWGGRFDQARLNQLQFAASQVRIMQDLEDSYAARSEQERLNQELGFARQLQATLLPDATPVWEEYCVHAFTSSAKEVNGDFYDFVEIDDSRVLIVMGDACGKGVPACLLASMTRSFVRAAAEHFTTLEALLREVNSNLYRDTDAERFVTMGCCLIDRKNSILEYGRAGHTELIYFIRNHIRRVYPDGAGLGILPDELATFDTISIEIVPDMALLLYSDGITEALNDADEEFGVDRLADVFDSVCTRHLKVASAVNEVLEKVNAFEPEQHDDRTLIMIHRNACSEE